MSKKDADTVEMWIRAVNKGAGSDDKDDYVAGIVYLTSWLEHGYKQAETIMSRQAWLKKICGYPKSYDTKRMDP